jgi:hypothetical protein
MILALSFGESVVNHLARRTLPCRDSRMIYLMAMVKGMWCCRPGGRQVYSSDSEEGGTDGKTENNVPSQWGQILREARLHFRAIVKMNNLPHMGLYMR